MALLCIIFRRETSETVSKHTSDKFGELRECRTLWAIKNTGPGSGERRLDLYGHGLFRTPPAGMTTCELS